MSIDNDKVLAILNEALELELAGVVRYNHYALMVFGHARIPIISWMREQATESMGHAQTIGEWITTLGGHPSLKIGPLLETHQHDIDSILGEVLEHERRSVDLLHQLLPLVADHHVALEEFVRGMILAEEEHIAQVDKMMRVPGELQPKR